MPSLKNSLPKKIVIFASGSGSNAENVIRYFRNNLNVSVEAVFSNKAEAKVLQRAKQLSIPNFYFSREAFYHSGTVLKNLQKFNPDLIVLAGFLWIFPQEILQYFPNKIINIHPALLPKFGGKGMFGMKVHQAVCEKKELETGISIHFINEKYDEGELIFQKKIPVNPSDSPEDVAAKIHLLEYEYFPKVIENLLFPAEND